MISFLRWPMLLLLGVIVFPMTLWAENWPNFRGPNFNGSSNEVGLPTHITKNNHLSWKAYLPGLGSSTPIVWDQSVFISALNKKATAVVALKLDLISGEILWQHEFCQASQKDRMSDMAGPSPTTNGKHVIFMSGSGKVCCFDFAGEKIWEKDIQKEYGPFSIKWTYSSSPMLFEKSLYIQVLQRDKSIDGTVPGAASYLLALDPETGEEKWKQERRSRASGESQEAYSSPIPVIHEGRKEIVTVGADCITGHNPKDGSEIWRWGTWNGDRATDWRIVPSPVYGDNMILACAPKGKPVYALFAGSSGSLNPGDLKWRSHQSHLSCDVPTPLFYGEYFYLLNGRKKILSCLDPYSGRVEWSQRIPARSKFEASPTAADGKLYIISHTGELFVYKAGPIFEMMHSTTLGQDPDASNRTTIVVANQRLLIRLGKVLWCMKE